MFKLYCDDNNYNNTKQIFRNDQVLSDYISQRNLVKVFGKEYLEDEFIFEIELSSSGNSNVYFIKDKSIYLLRNHLGDFKALDSKNSSQYDSELIKCFKALLNYSFKYIQEESDYDLLSKFNSRDYCFEVK
jgi:hypothetical protein